MTDRYRIAFTAKCSKPEGLTFYLDEGAWGAVDLAETFSVDEMFPAVCRGLLAAQRVQGHYELQSLTFERVPDRE